MGRLRNGDWLVRPGRRPAAHATASIATGTVHGLTVAMTWGAAVLFVAAVPIALCINAKAPARRR